MTGSVVCVVDGDVDLVIVVASGVGLGMFLGGLVLLLATYYYRRSSTFSTYVHVQAAAAVAGFGDGPIASFISQSHDTVDISHC